MSRDARYKIVDGPLEDSEAVWCSEDRKAADKMVRSLNRMNLKQGGPWGFGRYWIDDTEVV